MWFPNASDIIDLHDQILQRGGGEPGILANGTIEAAVHRCRWGPVEPGDLADRAAFLVRGIAQDHPFVDGNKRTAFEAAYLFLGRNGRQLKVPNDEVVEELVAIARGERELGEIAAWVRAHMEEGNS